MNETLTAVDGHTQLRMERPLSHPPEKVWRAITEPAHLNRWFPFNVEVELQRGGKLTFLEKEAGAGETTYGEVLAVEPPRLFAFSWGDDELRFELTPSGDGCVLAFTHTFADRAGAGSFASGWTACFDGLDDVLAGRDVEPRRDMDEVHEEFVAKFGLGAGTVEESADEWTVRFERQLVRPADVAWNFLAGTEPPKEGGPLPARFTTDKIDAGAITAVEAPTLLEYEWLVGGVPAGRVRWEFGEGTGQGARLILTQTGAPYSSDARPTALEAWQSHLDELGRQLLHTPRSGGAGGE